MPIMQERFLQQSEKIIEIYRLIKNTNLFETDITFLDDKKTLNIRFIRRDHLLSFEIDGNIFTYKLNMKDFPKDKPDKFLNYASYILNHIAGILTKEWDVKEDKDEMSV